MSIPPQSLANVFRSPLDAAHSASGARWHTDDTIHVVADYGETELERRQAFGHLALLDLSPLPRFGLKGTAIQTWLADRAFVVGPIPNLAYEQEDGCLAARLSKKELLFLCQPAQPGMFIQYDYFSPGRDCYVIRRRDTHYWFALTGEKASTLLAKLCGVDFSPCAFANHQVAQTQVARTSAIVVRSDVQETPCYYLLGDNSYCTYMWACLLDAMQEYEGSMLGTRAIG